MWHLGVLQCWKIAKLLSGEREWPARDTDECSQVFCSFYSFLIRYIQLRALVISSDYVIGNENTNRYIGATLTCLPLLTLLPSDFGRINLEGIVLFSVIYYRYLLQPLEAHVVSSESHARRITSRCHVTLYISGHNSENIVYRRMCL